MLGQQFYHETIRNVIVAFGTMFNNIQIVRKNNSGTVVQTMKVPLAYGPKQKFLVRLDQDPSATGATAITLPRLGFDITDISYDPTRKRNTLERRRTNLSGSTGGLASFSYAEVPYNFSFSLYGFVKDMTDALQLTEQILPYFTPEFNVTINFNDINKKVDVPFILNNVSIEEEYEGDFESRRNITTQYDFTAKSYVFGEIKKKEPILYTETTFFNLIGENYLTSGPSGAISRVDVGVSGASVDGAYTGFTMSNYQTYTNIYTFGPSGSTLSGQRYIDKFGNTYGSGSTYNPPNPS